MTASRPSITMNTVPATGSRLVMYWRIVEPWSQSTTVNPQSNPRASATQPTASSLDGVTNRRDTHRAVRMITPSMMGASSNSAVRSPTRGTSHKMRMGLSTNPAPKTRAKYIAPARRRSTTFTASRAQRGSVPRRGVSTPAGQGGGGPPSAATASSSACSASSSRRIESRLQGNRVVTARKVSGTFLRYLLGHPLLRAGAEIAQAINPQPPAGNRQRCTIGRKGQIHAPKIVPVDDQVVDRYRYQFPALFQAPEPQVSA